MGEAPTDRPSRRSEFKVFVLMRIRLLSRYITICLYRYVPMIHDNSSLKRSNRGKKSNINIW